jgi:hypothetical protein
MDTIAGAKFTHYYKCYNGYFVGWLPYEDTTKRISTKKENANLPEDKLAFIELFS